MNRRNNFDLIRLFAAFQVVFGHGTSHLKVDVPKFVESFVSYLPGVPIFFLISGFLISMSWERAPSLRQYVWNRALRIYPALWACLLFSIAIFIGCGVRPDSLPSFLKWLFAQITFFQFYNPDFLRGFGVGVINGSLWTIPVELEFYILLPLLAIAAKRTRAIWLIWALGAAALMIAATPHVEAHGTLFQKLLGVSIVPYLFYFVVGVIVRQLYEKHPNLFKGKFLLWAGAYWVWVVVENFLELEGRTGHLLNPLSIILLGMLSVSGAFSMPQLSSRILKDNDISYGVYIYHAPIMNLLLFNKASGVSGFVCFLAITSLAAMLSWRWIEKPALSLKNYSLKNDLLQSSKQRIDKIV